MSIGFLSLPDADDRHVLAAAIESGAFLIVTFNTRHFPTKTLAAYGVTAVKPNAFLCELFDSDSDAFMSAVSSLLDSLKNPPLTLAQLFQSWGKVGLSRLVEKVKGKVGVEGQ